MNCIDTDPNADDLYNVPRPDPENRNASKREMNQNLDFNKIVSVEILSDESKILEKKRGQKEIKMYGQKVINLSEHDLDEAEISLLSKGLKFCPTQKTSDAGELKKELDDFHNKLRTKQFFQKDEIKSNKSNTTSTVLDKISPYGNTTNFLKLRQKSNWKPPSGSPNLETFANVNDLDLGKSKFVTNRKLNISQKERVALKNLSKNKDLIIKPADKGGAIVIQNTRDYVAEANRQLSVESTYKKLDSNPTIEYNLEVETQLETMVKNGDITEKVEKVLSTNKPKTPNIYFLPKIHKQTLPPPGRPIVSANSCPTEKISAFVDHFLNPLVKESKSYIKDTTDFINKIENLSISAGSHIMGTLDVTALYTNIPNKEGIECIEEILKKERNSLEKPSNESLIRLLELVLRRNNFKFNGTQYLQIGGTAMGTRVAPTYANLFMRSLETKILNESEYKPTVWYRYIDDIFFIWEHGEDKLLIWLDYLNKYHSTIKFTVEYSKDEISFLDTKVKKSDSGSLYTDLYIKPTDTNSYLKYDSAHPPKCKDSLPYSQMLRIRRICKNDEDYQKHITQKRSEFIEKGYPERVINRAENEVSKRSREDLLTTKPKENIDKTKEKMFLTVTYREGYQYVPKIVKNNWDILARSCTTKNMHRADLMIGYHKPKDLRSHLVEPNLIIIRTTHLKKRDRDLVQTMKINATKKIADIAPSWTNKVNLKTTPEHSHAKRESHAIVPI